MPANSLAIKLLTVCIRKPVGEKEWNMMSKLNFDFSVEEFAVSLSLVKKIEEAKGLLTNAFGKSSPDEEKGRLLAAYNSLFARGLLTYGQGEAALHPDIKKMLDIFFDSRKLIKVGKSVDQGEDVVSYYSHQDGWLEHSIVQGVAYRFRYPVKEKEIQNNISKFFSPHGLSGKTPVCVDMPADLLNSPPGMLSNYDTVLAVLSKNIASITPEMNLLADDIVNGEWRGSTVWMNRVDEGNLLLLGYLWVQGKERLWTINSKTSDESFILQAALSSKDDFHLKLHELVFTKPDI
jgi:hypothetical protein